MNPTDSPTLMAIRIQTRQTTRSADNTAPRHVPENAAYLKQTIGIHPMVMDRHTWESIPTGIQAWPGRTRIVVTSTPELVDEGAITATDLEEALALASAAPGGEKVWVLAGTDLDQQVLDDPRLTEVHVITIDTRLDDREPAAELDETWVPTEVTAPTRSRNGHLYRVDRYTRR
ncbi:dihydrofolate reductase [Kocuria arenosa]|uniref:dihydrofolate reductase n=1 Tax=Kocuria arenosa TaxID=3071446 RepID=UPI0034D6ABF3